MAICCKSQQVSANQSSVQAPTPYSIVANDANSRVWQRTVYEQGPNGQVIPKSHSYTELASGLNHWLNGQWAESKEEIDILPDGTAAATNGQYHVCFPGNIYDGEILMVTPDGKALQSEPMALSYDDGTNTVLIATLTNSIGELVAPNEVVYPNAFGGLNADLEYTYKKGGFEQDVILHSQPPSPESLGLNPATTRLQVLTEFFNPPQPGVSTAQLPSQAGLALSDETLDFGQTTFAPGRAFLMGTGGEEAQAMVAKQWISVNGRYFLVEEVPVEALTDQLAALPLQVTQKGGGLPIMASHRLRLPPQHLAKASPFVHGTQLSQASVLPKAGVTPALLSKGLVLDYQILSGTMTNITFQGDTTYYISGSVTLNGTNTFEGGTVIKYATNATLTINSPSYAVTPNWNTGSYRPVIFTAIDDNTVGETLSGSTGTPTGYYANPMLSFSGTNVPELTNFRICYAKSGIDFPGGSSVVYPMVYDAQFIDCQYAIGITPHSQYYQNVLFANIRTNFNQFANGIGVHLQNATFVNIGLVASASSPGTISIYFTNCIFGNVTNFVDRGTMATNGNYNGFYNSPPFGSNQVTNTFYPFQIVGGGSYYLTNGCNFTNAGTTNIDRVWLAQLPQKTTHPPTIYGAGSSITSITTLSPDVLRDTSSSPDLGYHYDPLDYAFGGCDLYTNLTITAGTAVGFYQDFGSVGSSGEPYSLSLNNGAVFNATGTATAPCWITFADTAQEGCNENWTTRGWMGGFMLNGSGSGESQLNTSFTKMSGVNGPWQSNIFRDNWDQGVCNFQNSEFWMSAIGTYDEQNLNFSNCFFFRDQLYFYDQDDNPNITMENCTFYGGFMVIGRQTYFSSSVVTVKNTAFDGTAFAWGDNLNGTSGDTFEDYNSYNSSNLLWQSFSYPYGSCYGTLQTVGSHSLYVTNYNWETSWFGNYYLPINSPLIQAGSTTADQVGLYHFTTQTNQAPETNAVVDIGYHYVATDQYGNPLDFNGDGIPDYLEDPAGNGSGSWMNTMFLKVQIIQPQNGSVIP